MSLLGGRRVQRRDGDADAALPRSNNQKALLENALAVANRVPAAPSASGGQAIEESAWKNCWNWLVSRSFS